MAAIAAETRNRQGGWTVANTRVMRPLDCQDGFTPADRHAVRLHKLLGPRAFHVLQEEFGGKRVWVPKPGARFPCAACRTRGKCARRWKSAGRRPEVIAKHLGVSVKTVYRLLEAKARRRRGR